MKRTPRILTRSDARALGISMDVLTGPTFQRLFFDVYVPATTVVTREVLARATMKIAPAGSFISHHTAAALWGGCPPFHPEVHVSVPGAAWRTARRGICGHRASSAAEIVEYEGIRVSSAAQCFLDLAAARTPLVELVVLADSLVKAKRVSPEQLVRAAGDWRGYGAQRARRAARLVRDGVDSPMETRLRLLLVLAGLPEPRVNLIVRGPDGSWRMRFDLAYEQYQLAVEYDGRQHARTDSQWRRDLRRREELDREGVRIIVVTREGIYDEPEQTLRRVREALGDRGAPGLPKRFKTEWRQHFGR